MRTRFSSKLLVKLAALIISIVIFAWILSQRREDSQPKIASDLSAPPHEIIPGTGLYSLGMDTSFAGTVSYAVKTNDGIIVIDPGWSFEVLRRSLEYVGLRTSDVKIVLITHQHADHWFATRELVEYTGAKVMAHEKEIPLLTKPADLAQYFTHYLPKVREAPLLAEISPLHDGDVIRLGQYAIECIASAGHTQGGVCFRTEAAGYQVLWSGDIVMALDWGPIGGDYMTRMGPRYGGEAKAYLESLKRLQQLPIDVLLPGHPNMGKIFDPHIGPERWRTLLQPPIDRLTRKLTEFVDETRIFLDGKPKWLTREILYLGEVDGVASYVIDTKQGLICIDPGRRTLERLKGDLDAFRLNASDLKIVLLTSLLPEHAESAPAICQTTGAKLYCGRNYFEAGALQADRILDQDQTFELGNAKVTAFFGFYGDRGERCCLMQLNGRFVVIGGDSFGRFPLHSTMRLHEVSRDWTESPEFRVASRRLQREPVEILLPGHPRFDESPFYIPGEWPPASSKYPARDSN